MLFEPIMNPVIALVGRPNVGKSTLFNRLTRSRDALVADLPGLTRDRKYGEGKVGGKPYIVVDTGGITGLDEGIDAKMAGQSMQAIDEADIVLFLVDAKAGVMQADRDIADHLRRHNKSCYLVVNKVDGSDERVVTSEFFELGLASDPIGVAASHNRGVLKMIEHVLAEIPYPEDVPADEEEDNSKGTRICIVGRPNVGKSTLVNRLLGEDRVVVFDQSGTTRDSIYIPYERQGNPYVLIDTAGVRRRKNVVEVAEKFSIIKTLQAIQDCHVAVLVLDAREGGIVEQDLHLLSFIIDAGKALVIAVNKWDGMTAEAKDDVKKVLERRLSFTNFADMHFISALHGSGVGVLYKSVDKAYESASKKWQTRLLTQMLEDIVQEHQPPMINGRRIKLRFAHQGGSNPPIIVIHGNQTNKLPGSYKRYLENAFRRVLKVVGTPIKFEFKIGENPFAGRRKVAEGDGKRGRSNFAKKMIKKEYQKKRRNKR